MQNTDLPKLTSIEKTSRTGYSYNFKQEIDGKTQHFELLREGCSRTAVKLICAQRPACTARFHLDVVGVKLKIVCHEKKYGIHGTEAQLKDIRNYGTLRHNHRSSCRGKVH